MFKRFIAVASISVIGMLSTLLSTSVPAHADDDYNWASGDYDYASRQLDNFIDNHQRDLVNPVLKSVRQNARAGATSPAVPPTKKVTAKFKTTVAARTPTLPRLMAAAYPAANRAQAENVFTELLNGYSQIEAMFGIPKRDVAGATAAFLTASYGGYHNTDVPDEYFLPLVNQVRTALASSPDFGKTSVKSKQDTYEQMAILGMFVALAQLSLQKTPNPQLEATMRAAAGGYLQGFLGVDPNSVEITPNGMVLR